VKERKSMGNDRILNSKLDTDDQLEYVGHAKCTIGINYIAVGSKHHILNKLLLIENLNS